MAERVTRAISAVLAHEGSETDPTEDDRLVDDLGLDSLDMVELITALESHAGFESPDFLPEFPILRTVRDARAYVARLAQWVDEKQQTRPSNP